jgi:hypothetical protein
MHALSRKDDGTVFDGVLKEVTRRFLYQESQSISRIRFISGMVEYPKFAPLERLPALPVKYVPGGFGKVCRASTTGKLLNCQLP